ncbi:LysR substrate-binding domain-containing protein [Hydrogenophaga sp. BPS33]|uniref:LysR substrate-binding domain-containing protein n=1 Tax=Hydrogenophaga sp. BPS33 TaxID=2651974 RepID=UPI00135BD51B|nr:LysR substrate-binding domain-containing protein [Hydrogenophaga sp. BPS33]
MTTSTRINRLQIRHLQLLDHIVRLGSLSAAAAGIGVSQPRATNMLREMEDAFGCALLERSSRGARLNAAGVVALERLRIALGALDAACIALQHRQPRPVVRLGVLPLVGIDRLSRLVAQLEADDTLPRLVLRVGTVGELLAMLQAGEVDAAICSLDTSRANLPDGDRLHMVNLWEEQVLIVAAKNNPLTRRRRVSLKDLLQHPWLLMAGQSANRQALERKFLQAGLIPPEPQVQTDSPHICLALVGASRMVAAVPESAYRQAADRVRRVRVDCVFPSSWINLITLRDVPVLPFVNELARRLLNTAR